jgi:hypothetical protein
MNQPIAKTLVVCSFLAFTGVGLYAADRAYRPDTRPVAIAAQPGPAIGREADGVRQPRECDVERGVLTLCSYD